jgi:hypothetical protein
MAETEDDDSAGQFLTLSAAFAFLKRRTKSPAYDDLLLRKGLADESIDYCESETEVHFPDRGKPPVPGRVLVPPPPHLGADLWKVHPFDDSVQLKIDRRRSEATRIDYAVRMYDGTWQEYRIVRKRGLRVSRDDLKEILRLEKLLRPAPSTSATLVATEAADAAAINGTVSAVDSAPASIVEPANEPATASADPEPVTPANNPPVETRRKFSDLERRVRNAMLADPPTGEWGYAPKIANRLGVTDAQGRKTVSNYVSTNKQSVLEELRERTAKTSRDFPKFPNFPGKR